MSSWARPFEGMGAAVQSSAEDRRMLNRARADESAWDMIQRLKSEQVSTGVPVLDAQHVKLRPGTILEIAGPTGSGKTRLLLQVAVNSIIDGVSALLGVVCENETACCDAAVSAATHTHGTPAASLRSVLLFDLDSKLESHLITQVVETQLAQTFPQADARVQWARALLRQCYVKAETAATTETGGPGLMSFVPQGRTWSDLQTAQRHVKNWEETVNNCLQRLHIVRPQSSLETLAALISARTLLAECKAAGRPCSLLLLDDVGAFTYLDKAHRSHVYAPELVARASTGDGGCVATRAPAVPLGSSRVHKALASAIRALSRQHRVCVIATKTTRVTLLGADERGPPRLQAKEYMSNSWTQAVTHRLLLGSADVVPGREPGTFVTQIPSQLCSAQGVHNALRYVYINDCGVT